MAIDCLWKTEAGTQTLKHRRCNTNANTVAATQMRTAATQMKSQTLKHSVKQSWNTEANADG